MTTKKYPDSDEVMLIKTKVAIYNAIEDVADFTPVQPSITKESLTAFEKEIDSALANFVGIDKKEGLRNATTIVDELTENAFKQLRLIKTLIEVNFKEEAKEMFNHYGFTSFYTDVAKRKHEPAISLLATVARDAEKLKEKFASKSLPTTTIDEVVKLAIELPQAETKQEQQKAASKPITEEQRKTLNDIYVRIMDICKLGRVIFADDEVKKSRYIFKKLGGISRKINKTNDEVSTTDNNSDNEENK